MIFLKEMNIQCFKSYRENYFYTKYRNIHQLNNIYKKESSKLIIRKKFLLLQSTVVHPSFMKELENYSNLFFCDFQNKDYFWLDHLFIH